MPISNRILPITVSMAMTLFMTAPAWAGVSAEKAAELGSETLTPTGAERAGNAEGTIPAWDGGLTSPPSNYEPGGRYVSPFPGDKPKFVITAENVEQHKESLTAGQLELFQRFPDNFKMPVYQTRRTLARPQWVYDAIKENAASSELVAQGEGISGAVNGVPFPFPEATSNPAKAIIWNHKTRYQGQGVRRFDGQVSTSGGGNFGEGNIVRTLKFNYNQKGIAREDLNNILIYFFQRVTAPARRAGGLLLVHETLNQVEEPRRAWRYNPGQRRVLRAPNVAYDNPSINVPGGIRTNDQFDMYNGATDRYDWKLLGKKEIYVPYNSYKLHNAARDNMFGPKTPNQDLMRYERHRVWVVEGKVKEGTSHIYARRRFYVDEDSWHILAVDIWDSRGGIYQYQEAHTVMAYDQPLMQTAMDVVYDLSAGRYSAAEFNNGQQEVEYGLDLDDSFFSPRNLARQADK